MSADGDAAGAVRRRDGRARPAEVLPPEASRRLPIGAELRPDGAHFRVWAPRRQRVAVVLEGAQQAEQELAADGDGYFAGLLPAARAGSLYRFRLDQDAMLYPDPASRFQPDGPHGPSEVIDPAAYVWTDLDWRGRPLAGQVLYELHVGTFTPEGTFAAATHRLPELAELGVTTIELMPLAAFPGRFGWGYDGTSLFAPTQLYGRPDDVRHFVDRAHAAGIGVILDVVYNHVGPDGNFLDCFSGSYFTDRYINEWGQALNYDGADAGPVREFVLANAAYWIGEFHLDGLRLDATQQMFDASPVHIVRAIQETVRQAAGGRTTLVIAENEPQRAGLVRPVGDDRDGDDGCGLDALWNDDFHHSAVVALTGRNEAYYTDYRGTPQELISAVRWGFLYQGQHYAWQGKARGVPALDLPGPALVTFLQNHDQIANSGRGERIDRQTSPGRLRAATALLLLGPGTPMLFQGQEFAASAPFRYFADHRPDLARQVAAGRKQFVSQFPSTADPALLDWLPDPADPETFAACKLDHGERERHAGSLRLHRDLLRLRRADPVFAAQRADLMAGAVLAAEVLVLRFFDPDGAGDDRLLLLNLGRDLPLPSAPEPLLAPPAGAPGWRLLWSSEHPAYGGAGARPPERGGRWHLAGHAAAVLRPAEDPAKRPAKPPSANEKVSHG
jgi:maltooligosyltrehalose trehalohydrolase